MNVAVVAPEAIVTDDGTVAALVVSLLSEIERPLEGAADPIVTVPVEDVRPVTAAGETTTEVKTGGLTVNVAV